MQAPPTEDSAERRPRLSVVRKELRSRESGIDRERSRRLRAHPLAYDEHGFPTHQPPLTVAGRAWTARDPLTGEPKTTAAITGAEPAVPGQSTRVL